MLRHINYVFCFGSLTIISKLEVRKQSASTEKSKTHSQCFFVSSFVPRQAQRAGMRGWTVRERSITHARGRATYEELKRMRV